MIIKYKRTHVSQLGRIKRIASESFTKTIYIFLCAEILVIIPKIGERSAFFCSSQFLEEAFNNPTGFCEAQGVLIQYASLVIGELFVIYNVVLFKVSLTKFLWKTSLLFKVETSQAPKLQRNLIWTHFNWKEGYCFGYCILCVKHVNFSRSNSLRLYHDIFCSIW